MTTVAKAPPKTPAQQRKWKEGASYRCILSKSPAYRKGDIYKCHNDTDKGLCLTGKDGFIDPVGMLVSGFVECDGKKVLTDVLRVV